MNENTQRALVFAYYLSKFNLDSLTNLNFTTWNEAYTYAGSKWNIKPTTIKNMRDEFDPIMDNPRAGWYQKPLSRSRVSVHEQYSEIPFTSFTILIKSLLDLENNKEFDFTLAFNETEISNTHSNKTYSIQRNATGLTAEEIFITKFKQGFFGNEGVLVDTRNNGCGYDFQINYDNTSHYYEIKGRFNNSGGILLTEKEWSLAKTMQDSYHLVLISNISSPGKELMNIYTDPTKIFNAKLNIQKIIQTSWIIPESEL